MELKLNLGAARNIKPYEEGWRNCDIARGPGIDVSFDAGGKWPFPSDYFELIYANHVLDHIRDLDTCMREAQRVLKPNGIMEIKTPFGPTGTFVNDDPNHLRAFYTTTLRQYCQDGIATGTLEADWEEPLFKQESCEVIRIMWQRQRLGRIFGHWVERQYTFPFGLKQEIKWILRKV